MLVGPLGATTGCGYREPTAQMVDSPVSIERPAGDLRKEQGIGDRVGEIGIVLLVLGLVAAGIALPLLLL